MPGSQTISRHYLSREFYMTNKKSLTLDLPAPETTTATKIQRVGALIGFPWIFTGSSGFLAETAGSSNSSSRPLRNRQKLHFLISRALPGDLLAQIKAPVQTKLKTCAVCENLKTFISSNSSSSLRRYRTPKPQLSTVRTASTPSIRPVPGQHYGVVHLKHWILKLDQSRDKGL
jgi:hypothetical protein